MNVVTEETLLDEAAGWAFRDFGVEGWTFVKQDHKNTLHSEIVRDQAVRRACFAGFTKYTFCRGLPEP